MAQDLHSLHEKASEAMAEGDVTQAIELYKEILNEAPADEIAYGQLMDLYFDRDKFQYYLMRANYNVVNQKYEHAINDTKKALAIEPDSIDARTKLARLYKITNKNLKAIDEFTKILELTPKDRNTYFELVSLYQAENAEESAVGVIKKGVEELTDDLELKNLLAKLYFDLNEYNLALEVVQDQLLKIKILLAQGNNEEAKAVLDNIKASNSMNKELKIAYNLLLAEYYYNMDNYDEALETIRQYVNLQGPDAVSFQMKALVYESKGDEFQASVNFGYMKKAQGKDDEAIVEFNRAHQLNSKDKDVLIELANLYMKLGEKYTAIDFWNSVYELDHDAQAKAILGDFYFKEGDYRMAEKYGKFRETKEKAGKVYEGPEVEDEGLIEKIINFFSGKK